MQARAKNQVDYSQLADERRKEGNAFYEVTLPVKEFQLLNQKGQFQAALEKYDEAIEVNPKDARSYANRAACFMAVKIVCGSLRRNKQKIQESFFFSKCVAIDQ